MRDNSYMERITLTVATIGILTAIVAGVLYLMRLHIFTSDQLEWTFFGGLVSAAFAIGALMLNGVWGKGGYQ